MSIQIDAKHKTTAIEERADFSGNSARIATRPSDAFRDTLEGPSVFSNMKNASTYSAPSKLRAASSISEKMIKTDHAGENGAVNIYRAQRMVASVRARSLLPQLLEFQSHEEEHRRIFGDYLRSVGVRRCVSYHLCGAGGFALGFVTAIFGPKAIAATTYAVEHVVLKHLEEQLSYLVAADKTAYECVAHIYADEKEHHDTAEDMFDLDGRLTRMLIKLVKFSTEWVIRIGMR